MKKSPSSLHNVPLTLLATLICSTLAHANISQDLFAPNNWQANLTYYDIGDLSLSHLVLDSTSKDKLTAGIVYRDTSDNAQTNSIILNNLSVHSSNLSEKDPWNSSLEEFLTYGILAESTSKQKDIVVNLTGKSQISIENSLTSVDNAHILKYSSAGIAAYSGKNSRITTSHETTINGHGRGVNGIFAEMSLTGSESIQNNGHIATSGEYSTGIQALNTQVLGANNHSEQPTIIENNGTITNHANIAADVDYPVFHAGIQTYSNSLGKKVSISNNGKISVSENSQSKNADNGGLYHGISAGHLGFESPEVGNGNELSDKSTKEILNSGEITLLNGGTGIYAGSRDGASHTVTNDGLIKHEGTGYATGIESYLVDSQTASISNFGDILLNQGVGIDSSGGFNRGLVQIYNAGTISATEGIIHHTHPSASATIINDGFIYTTATGIFIDSSPKSTVINSGVIETSGEDAHAIQIQNVTCYESDCRDTHSADMYTSIINTDTIITQGAGSDGITAITQAKDGDVYDTFGGLHINNSGGIFVHGDDSHGIRIHAAKFINPLTNTIYNDGSIAALGENSTAISIANHKDSANSTQLFLDENSNLIGGTAAGEAIKITDYVNNFSIVNKGAITAISNMAITANQNQEAPSAQFSLANEGIITGNLYIEGDDVKINNHAKGIFELEHIDDYTGEQEVAFATFAGKNAIFKNAGQIQFSDVMMENNLGYFTGLTEFHLQQDGIIDLTQNNTVNANGFGRNNFGVGDVFTITGEIAENPIKQTIFYSNGGILRLNTDLTTAGALNVADRLTDKLVLDRTQSINGAPTWIDIVPTAKSRLQAKQTAGDGFLVVEVKDKANSDRDAFRLLHPVVAAKYEYILGQKQGDWYLTSDCTAGMTCFGSNEKKLYNPATGAYLANQAAMTAMTSHSLSERLNSPLSQPSGLSNSLVSKLAASRDVAQKAQAFAMLNALAYQQQESFTSPVWVQHSNANQFSSSVFGSLDNKSKTDFMRLGGDLMASRWMSGDVSLGFMSTMGNSTADVASKATGTKSRGEVAGYTAGVYGTWLNDAKTGHGLYVDSWAQVGHFSNKVKGQTQRFGDEKYNSQIASSSIESGYTFAFNGGNKQKDGFTFTPQAQFIYHKLGTNDFTDRNGMHVRASNNDGVVSRLGFRVATGKKGLAFGENNRVHASFESHWVRNGLNNQLDFDGEKFSDNKAKNSLETKLGVQADIGNKFQFNSNVNHQFRKGDKDNYGAYSGVSYRF